MADIWLVYRVHAIHRMFERGITAEDVRTAIDEGDVIEEYPDDEPYPSRLISGNCDAGPLHVVVADRPETDEVIVITVYVPDPDLWDAEFKRRRR